MPYSPPAGNAADLQFRGPYVVRLGNFANLSFEALATGVTRADGWTTTAFGAAIAPKTPSPINSTTFGTTTIGLGLPATGFSSVVFGSPRVGTDHPVTGFSSTTFGTPLAPYTVMPINGTMFGLPNSPYLQTGVATSINSTTFGDQRLGSLHYAFASNPSTTFSLAYTAFAQTAEAVGQVHTRFGTPTYQVLPTITGNRVATPDGFSSTAFGTPSSPYDRTLTAYGFSGTRFGWPGSYTLGASSRVGTPTSGFITYAGSTAPGSSFGTPTFALRQFGFSTGGVGAPSSRITPRALAIAPRTTFGVPYSRIGGHKAFGIDLGRRFGRASATSRVNRTATAVTGTALGTPTALDTHHATMLPPSTAFGEPLMKWNPAC